MRVYLIALLAIAFHLPQEVKAECCYECNYTAKGDEYLGDMACPDRTQVTCKGEFMGCYKRINKEETFLSTVSLIWMNKE